LKNNVSIILYKTDIFCFKIFYDFPRKASSTLLTFCQRAHDFPREISFTSSPCLSRSIRLFIQVDLASYGKSNALWKVKLSLDRREIKWNSLRVESRTSLGIGESEVELVSREKLYSLNLSLSFSLSVHSIPFSLLRII